MLKYEFIQPGINFSNYSDTTWIKKYMVLWNYSVKYEDLLNKTTANNVLKLRLSHYFSKL